MPSGTGDRGRGRPRHNVGRASPPVKLSKRLGNWPNSRPPPPGTGDPFLFLSTGAEAPAYSRSASPKRVVGSARVVTRGAGSIGAVHVRATAQRFKTSPVPGELLRGGNDFSETQRPKALGL